MTPRPDVTEERKNQILEAATAVFARLGFHKARMDDVAEESGLSKGTLYWYFKSKDEIILGLVDRIFTQDMKALETALDSDLPAGELLIAFAQIGIEETKHLRPLMPLMFEFISLAARHKSVLNTISGYYQKYQRLLTQVIQQGIDSGEFNLVDPQATAITFIALLEGMVMIWFINPELIEWDVMGDLPMDIFLNGIRALNTLST